MDKVLVTGGAGFIGSHLVEELLKKGYDVVVLDNFLRGNKIPNKILKEVNVVKGDVKNKDLVISLSKNCKYIYHFAAVLGVDVVADKPIETMETEVIGMQNVTEASVINGVEKIIYASTSGVYDHSALEQTVTEDISLDPKTSYAIAKRFNEIYLSAFYEEKNVNSIILRFFNIYGPRQDTRMVIPRFFEQALTNNPITIYGNGNQTRDFTYVKDAVKATILLSETVKGYEIFNISNEKEITIKELAKKIKNITNSSSEITYIKIPTKRWDYEVERRIGCSKKLYSYTNYKPTTKLEDGLKIIYHNLIVSEPQNNIIYFS